MKNCQQQKAQEIFDRLYSRNLFKMVAELYLKDEGDFRVKRRLCEIADHKNREQQLAKEKEIAHLLRIDADYVIIKVLQIRNPNYGSRSYIMNPEAIKIFDEKHAVLKVMNDYTNELYFSRPSGDEAASESLQVYALYENWHTLNEQCRSGLESDIRDILRAD